ncbi:MAG: ORF6N domain-containing protein [Bacilli bacterium]|nr:ORF6N domain-containing protein [Bacilli bacterium]
MNQIIKNENIENLIYEIRGKQVMLDSDLAKLYQVETKRINEAVYRNKEKFPERFCFKLSDEESYNFLVAICDQKNERRGGRYKNPRVFTEQGVAMLATVLKSKAATQVSIKIMDAFVAMKKYISNNLINQKYYNDMTIRHDSEIKLLQESFNKFEEKKINNETYYNGQIYDAYSKIIDIFKTANNELIIIDRFADKSVLDMIKDLDVNVILIVKRNGLLKKMDIEKYNRQYDNLKIIYNGDYHDRYFIIDQKEVYHCGASIKHAGSRTFSINKGKIKRYVKTSLIT